MKLLKNFDVKLHKYLSIVMTNGKRATFDTIAFPSSKIISIKESWRFITIEKEDSTFIIRKKNITNLWYMLYEEETE